VGIWRRIFGSSAERTARLDGATVTPGPPAAPNDAAAVLSGASSFAKLPDIVKTLIASCVEERRFAAGDLLLRQGEPGDGLFVIAEGAVEVSIRDERGQRHTLTRAFAGDVIGEMALLTGEPRNADVAAVTAVRALLLSAASFQNLAGRHPEISVVLTNLVADRLGQKRLDALGEKVLNGYRIRRCLGRGGMAVVYEAEEVASGRRLALKMMSHRLIYEQDALERFQREADIIEGLEHPNIARLYGRFAGYKTYFLVMEFCDGASLSQVLGRHAPLAEEEARKILGQVSLALAYIHAKGVVHRDLKPSNIMLNRDGSAKLMDFGIAKSNRAAAATALTQGGIILGTPAYMPPEQFSGREQDGRLADIYAFGCMALEMLSGKPLFRAEDLVALIYEKVSWKLPLRQEVQEGLSEELYELIARAMAGDPRERGADFERLGAWAAPFDLRLLEELPEEAEAAAPAASRTRTAKI
jgi:CRP-like cAMP-binding protein